VPEMSNSRWIQERSEAGLCSSFRTATLALAINNIIVKKNFNGKKEVVSKLFWRPNTCKGVEYQSHQYRWLVSMIYLGMTGQIYQ